MKCWDLTSEQWMLLTGMGATLGLAGVCRLGMRLPFPRLGRATAKGPGIEIAGQRVPDEARLRHTHIVGATGSGKTVLLEQLIYRDLERGHGALIIDPKGDRDLYDRIRRFCQKIGRERDLSLLSATYLDESIVWNPCRIGNASELQSKFYNSAIYSEPHYAKACELALLKVFTGFDPEDPVTLADVVASLEKLSKGGKDETISGLFLDLNNLTLGDWGVLLGCREGVKKPELSLLDVTRRNEILFVDLPTEAQAVQSARIGRLLLQEVILISGLRKLYPHLRSKQPFSVFVDEFDAFASPAFSTFLNKGRSSDFMIHLAHQTLSDLDRVGPAFKGQIMGNMNVRFIFRQDDPEDAETWSRFFGTKKVIKRTFQTQGTEATGLSSNREAQEFRISPDEIKDLKIGECIFSIKTEGDPRKLKIPFSPTRSFEPKLSYPIIRSENPRSCEKLTSTSPKVSEFDQKANWLQSLMEDAK